MIPLPLGRGLSLGKELIMPIAILPVRDVQELANDAVNPSNVTRLSAVVAILNAALNLYTGDGTLTADTVTTEIVPIQPGTSPLDIQTLFAQLQKAGYKVIPDPTLQQFTILFPRV